MDIETNKSTNPSIEKIDGFFNIDKCQGILYIAPIGTNGYAKAAKSYIYDFIKRGIPVKYEPLYWDNTVIPNTLESDIVVNNSIQKNISYNVAILHTTPEHWPEFIKKYKLKERGIYIIGQTVWETDKIDDRWIEPLNNVDEVWVPCKWNKHVFENCDVNVPIKIVPHIIDVLPLPDKSLANIEGYDPKKFTFYNISHLTERKGIDDLLHAYCQAFTIHDNVQLILKIHGENYTPEAINNCKNFILTISQYYKNHPPILYVHKNLTEKELLQLHAVGDCYVSLCKAEGWGLGAYEAYKYNKPVIITGYGGQLDFLGENYPYLIKYCMIPVEGMHWIPWYNSTQKWAQPDLKHASELMLSIYKLSKINIKFDIQILKHFDGIKYNYFNCSGYDDSIIFRREFKYNNKILISDIIDNNNNIILQHYTDDNYLYSYEDARFIDANNISVCVCRRNKYKLTDIVDVTYKTYNLKTKKLISYKTQNNIFEKHWQFIDDKIIYHVNPYIIMDNNENIIYQKNINWDPWIKKYGNPGLSTNVFEINKEKYLLFHSYVKLNVLHFKYYIGVLKLDDSLHPIGYCDSPLLESDKNYTDNILLNNLWKWRNTELSKVVKYEVIFPINIQIVNDNIYIYGGMNDCSAVLLNIKITEFIKYINLTTNII
jgi:glycosyltransferase involved in cell wall biosynthesis